MRLSLSCPKCSPDGFVFNSVEELRSHAAATHLGLAIPCPMCVYAQQQMTDMVDLAVLRAFQEATRRTAQELNTAPAALDSSETVQEIPEKPEATGPAIPIPLVTPYSAALDDPKEIMQKTPISAQQQQQSDQEHVAQFLAKAKEELLLKEALADKSLMMVKEPERAKSLMLVKEAERAMSQAGPKEPRPDRLGKGVSCSATPSLAIRFLYRVIYHKWDNEDYPGLRYYLNGSKYMLAGDSSFIRLFSFEAGYTEDVFRTKANRFQVSPTAKYVGYEENGLIITNDVSQKRANHKYKETTPIDNPLFWRFVSDSEMLIVARDAVYYWSVGSTFPLTVVEQLPTTLVTVEDIDYVGDRKTLLIYGIAESGKERVQLISIEANSCTSFAGKCPTQVDMGTVLEPDWGVAYFYNGDIMLRMVGTGTKRLLATGMPTPAAMKFYQKSNCVLFLTASFKVVIVDIASGTTSPIERLGGEYLSYGMTYEGILVINYI